MEVDYCSDGMLDKATHCPHCHSRASDDFFWNLNWETKGIKINGDVRKNPRFADDVVPVVGCWETCKPCWRNSTVRVDLRI